jgi:flagellar M-ring protein FliF
MADGDLARGQSKSINPLVAGFNNLALLRQLGLMIGLAASVAIGFGVVLWSKESNYRPLYLDLSTVDAVAASDILQQNNIPFKFDSNEKMLLVASDKIHEARLKMAAAGYAPAQQGDQNLMNKDSSFGTSQFVESVRYQHSIELELGRTIASIQGVRSARVHLAIPKRSVFVGDQRKPSASVLIDLYQGKQLNKPQVSAIVHLVASSIPELSDKSVTVVDQRGDLLSNNDENDGIAEAGKQYEYVRKLEQSYIERIRNILTPILGEERFNVEVSAEVDFSTFEQASEQFNPDTLAIRSEKVMDEERGSADVGGVPGALSNQPPADASVPEIANGGGSSAVTSNTSNKRKQATRNFEIDRTVSHARKQFGSLNRLSVAVVVDVPDPVVAPVADPKAADAKPVNKKANAKKTVSKNEQTTPENNAAKLNNAIQALTPAELDQLTQLVKNAIGYDVARGDMVTLIPQRFVREAIVEALPVEEISFWEQAWFADVVKQVLAVIAILAVIFGVLRPILKNISATGKKELEFKNMLNAEANGQVGGREYGGVTLSSGPDALLPGPNDRYEQQISAVRSMVSDDPRKVAQVIKRWVSSSDG